MTDNAVETLAPFEWPNGRHSSYGMKYCCARATSPEVLEIARSWAAARNARSAAGRTEGAVDDMKSSNQCCFWEAGAHSHLSVGTDLYRARRAEIALRLTFMKTARATRLNDSGRLLYVMGLDSGTWPMDGGGVASAAGRGGAARGVNWDMIAETGNDMKKVHRAYKVEGSVSSLSLIPLWGNDLGSPNQTVKASLPMLQLKVASWLTTDAVIRCYFAPLIRGLIAGCNAISFTKESVETYTTLFVNLHTFFERFDWVTAWEHHISV